MTRVIDLGIPGQDDCRGAGWSCLKRAVFDDTMGIMRKKLINCEQMVQGIEHACSLELTLENVVEILEMPQAELFRCYFMGFVLSGRDWDRWVDPVRLFTPEISIAHFVEIMCRSTACEVVGQFAESMRKNKRLAGLVFASIFNPKLERNGDFWWRRDTDTWLIDMLIQSMQHARRVAEIYDSEDEGIEQ